MSIKHKEDLQQQLAKFHEVSLSPFQRWLPWPLLSAMSYRASLVNVLCSLYDLKDNNFFSQELKKKDGKLKTISDEYEERYEQTVILMFHKLINNSVQF